MYVFSRDSYIGETCTGLDHDENRETPEQGSLISALPRAIQVILVWSAGLLVFPGPKNVSPASLESFLCKTRIPAGFVPSGVRFSYYISSEADSMKILNKDGKNPVYHNIKNRFYRFDGSKYPHETAPFKGERYTLVFYST